MRPKAERVLVAFEEAGVEEAGDVVGGNRAVGDAASGGFDFDQGFSPEQAPGSVADYFDAEIALGSGEADCVGYGFGACGESCGVGGDEDFGGLGEGMDRGRRGLLRMSTAP